MSAPPLWHRFDGPMNDASAATLNLLRGLNVAAAPRSVAGFVTAHPAYPSLAAIIDGLAEFGVRATARRIAVEGLSSLPYPALLHVRDGGPTGAFWLVSDQRDGRFECRLPNGESRSVSEEELASCYLGIAVTGVAEPFAGERYAARHELGDALRARLPLAARALFVISLIASCAAASLATPGAVGPALALAVLGFVGLGLTLELSFQSPSGGSGLLARLCPTGKTFNCASVVGSAGGRIRGVVPLADVGAAFFAAQIASGTVAAVSGHFDAFLALFLLFGAVLVLVIAYSLVQQAVVVRRWCPLCLAVDAVLAGELVLVARTASLRSLGALDPRSTVLLVGTALGAALAYAVVRPLVTPAVAAPRLHAELEALRGIPEVLGASLARTAPVETDVPGKLVEGDAAAPVEIVIVSHPFCVACADAHAAIGRLVEAFPKLVRAATVFSVSDVDRAASAAARVLLGGELELGTWYARLDENVARWLANGAFDGAESQASVLAAQRVFAEGGGIAATPSFFVNGRPLPPGFGLHHLRYYLRAEQRRLKAAGAAARESA